MATRRRCSFCADRARYLYQPRTAMCAWHLLMFYLGVDYEWKG